VSASRPPVPLLPLEQWRDTYDTLHRWTQIVGKTRLALSPPSNHWWHVALAVTSRGVGTSPMPCGPHTIEVDFDFVEHNLVARRSDGASRTLPLVPMSVAEFYGEYLDLLASLDVSVGLRPIPSEMPDTLPFTADHLHAAYDREAVGRMWQALSRADLLLKECRDGFLGKCSPTHFWWGAFDLACTRFSGRRAPPHPGGIPNLPDRVTREAYSHECISAGWWPGGGSVTGPAFYAYAYPLPEGCPAAEVRPGAAYFDGTMGEWLLPWPAEGTSDADVTEFVRSTYEAAARLSGWDRAALER
jgi:hypothetical protein